MMAYVLQFHKSKAFKQQIQGLPIETRKKLIENYFKTCKAVIKPLLDGVEIFGENAFMLSMGVKGKKDKLNKLRNFILDSDLGIIYQDANTEKKCKR